jgi:demethylmenaquinone methyltransferase/2-methoxy-6-polyprenyl-1,4-benzoquinol methylase
MRHKELPFIREMFDGIAPRYDFLNRLLSLRQDVAWRKKMVSMIDLPENGRVLDVACGTGDVALEFYRQKGARVKVVGLDFSLRMLHLAQKKIQRIPEHRISLINADALCLPFGKPAFDAVTIAFGIRNIQNKTDTLKAFFDCLVPGGKVGVLELATPGKKRVSGAYNAYFMRVLPVIGRLFSRHGFAYSYLPESVSRFPEPEAFKNIMVRSGFSTVSIHRLTFGVARLYVGTKPAQP